MATAAVALEPAKIPALTGVRFMAAGAVVLYHSESVFLQGSFPLVKKIASFGYMGVSFFFVLSGFVLAYTYFQRESFDRRMFFWARFARIVPLYFASLLIQAPLIALHRFDVDGVTTGTAKFFASLAPTAALLQAWHPSLRASWNNPAWSISVEALFYLLFAWKAWQHRNLVRRFAPSCFAIATVLAIAVPVAVHLTYSSDVPEQTLELIKYNPLLHVPEFVAGVALFFCTSTRVRACSWTEWGVVSACVAILCTVLAFVGPMYLLLHNGLGILPFAVVIRVLADLPQGRFFSNKALVLLGEASYAVYLLHIPILQWLIFLVTPRDSWRLSSLELPMATSGLWGLAYVTVLLALSVLSFLYLEGPLRRWIRTARRNNL